MFTLSTTASISKRWNWRGAAAGLICGLLAWSMTQPAWVQGLDDWLFDACFCWRGARPTSNHVLIVGIDDATFQRLNKPSVFISPLLARAVRHLHEQGATAIGLDIIESMRDLTELRAGGVGDATTLGQSIADAGNVSLSRSPPTSTRISSRPASPT